MFLKIYNSNKKLVHVIPYDQILELSIVDMPTVNDNKEFLGLIATKGTYRFDQSQYVYDLNDLIEDMINNVSYDLKTR